MKESLDQVQELAEDNFMRKRLEFEVINRKGVKGVTNEADINVDIPFKCKIGGVKATLGILIEPDPHGDGKGAHAHFHTTII